MKKVIMGTLVLFFLMMFSASALAEDYRLGPGDVLNISVWGYEELTLEQTAIRPDGKVSFPIVGDVQAEGLTPGELAVNLTNGLSKYVNNPKVIANVFKFRTTRVYVLGEVPKPGLYELDKRHNLLDAIGAAGGYTKDAAKKKVHIIHHDQTDKPVQANLLNLLQRGDMTQNYALREGDVVFLSNNGRIDFAKDIMPFVTGAYYISEFNNN